MSHPAYQGTGFVTQSYHQLNQATGLIKKAQQVKGSDPLLRARLAFDHIAQALELLNTITYGALDEAREEKVFALLKELRDIESGVNQKQPQEVLDAIALLEV